MSKEIKISIGIMVLGIIAMIIYWFMPQDSLKERKENANTKIEERIILPQFEKSIYQNIPEVKSYLSDIKQMIKEGEAVLPLHDSELDSRSKKVQKLLLKDTNFLKDTKEGDTFLHNDMMRILPAINK